MITTHEWGGKKRSVLQADDQMHRIRGLFKRSQVFRTTLDWLVLRVPAGSGESRFGPVTVAATELRLAAQILT